MLDAIATRSPLHAGLALHANAPEAGASRGMTIFMTSTSA
jgi:hypothetical protein